MVNHSRSLTGCAACRTRHLKCDETRPTCQMCQITGLECPGYNCQIKWPVDTSSTQEPGTERPEDRVFRRPLYQGVEQELMTQITVDSLGQKSANAALSSIDRWLDSHSEPSFFYGPFGVIDFLQGDRLEGIGSDYETTQSNVEESLSDYDNTVVDETALPCVSVSGLYARPTPSRVEIPHNGNFHEGSHHFLQKHQLTTSSKHFATISIRALELLRHFKDHVISLSFPMKGNPNCPWKTIHLPTAMETYTELLVGDKASHTSLSLLYSLLSASCAHRAARLQRPSEYEELRVSNNALAKKHLEFALEEEMTGRVLVKYKGLLMSILSMVVLEIHARSYNNAQKLLVDAEQLIRRRGFPKSLKSTKVRALHHVYTWLRIMAESTCGCALVSVCPSRPDSHFVNNGEPRQSLRSFRLSDPSSLADLDMNAQKSSAAGHHDIHLELMGAWDNSLFQDLYGVPESLLGLLSQTVRLANEQELLTRDTLVDADAVTNLNKRTKTLEQQILSWAKRLEEHLSPLSTGGGPRNPHVAIQKTSYNALAMHQSLILFYYRRIHNINAIILQDTVKKAIRFIEQAGGSNETEEHNAALLWPCFIAACEALDKPVQALLLDWLRDMLDRTAVDSFAVAADVVQNVWRARQETGDLTLSWFDILGHDRCPIIVV